MFEKTKYHKVFSQLKEEIGLFSPDAAIILGSGLGIFADEIEEKTIIPTSKLDFYPKSTVEGHKGNIIFGKIGNKKIIAFQGRIHFYEGYTLEDAVFPVILAHLFEAKTLITTNVSGGINSNYKPGDIILINNHINLTFKNPVRNLRTLVQSARPDVDIRLYDTQLLDKAAAVLKQKGFDPKFGTYLWTLGPSYETPAEIQAFKKLGADMVGMSTVPEVLTGAYLGMRILGISLISNLASGISEQKLSHQEVIEISEKNKHLLGDLLKNIINEL